MKRKLKFLVALTLVITMLVPMTAFAAMYDDPSTDPTQIFHTYQVGDDGRVYIPLRAFAYSFGATVEWDAETGAILLTGVDGMTHRVFVERINGFIQDGVSWVPVEFAEILRNLLNIVFVERRVPRIDLNLWAQERFAEIREPAFTTDLPHGEIAVAHILHMNDYLPARSAFSYPELDAAIWLVEELLSMGHNWDNIDVQEFTYWDVRLAELGMWGLSWWQVTSEWILGVDRDHLIRYDRVSQNVVLTIPGQSDRTIIVGAHYDSPPFPSASDNASGSALLLESALRMMELDNYYTIVYVWFGAEEVGLIGAYYFYYRLSQAERDNIVMMINADILIEGPYTIFGAGSMPELNRNDLIRMISDWMVYSNNEWREFFIQDMMEWDGLTLEEAEELWDEMVQNNLEWIQELPEEVLINEAMWLGLLEPQVDSIARQINQIASALNSEHDFELLPILEAVLGGSDHLVFLHEGHTIVNFLGLERFENMDRIMAYMSRIYRFEIMFDGEFMLTVLHGPYDDFHVIERIWPGMMLDNLRAYVLFLEEILTSRFTG